MSRSVASRSQMGLPLFPTDGSLDDRHTVANPLVNRLGDQDRAFHAWYRFVLSFPPPLVARYLDEFQLQANHTVLDPFCGTGTTLVEAKLRGIPAIGLEVNPFACFASRVKTDWSIDPDGLREWAGEVGRSALKSLARQGLDDNAVLDANVFAGPLRTLNPDTYKLLIKGSISQIPLHKTLVLLDCLRERHGDRFYGHGLLALGNALAVSVSNLRFGPEVGVGKVKSNSPVVALWLAEIDKMCRDLARLPSGVYPGVIVHPDDARAASLVLAPYSVDAVITSPPYPNEKDYTRTTRLESAVLGFVTSKAQLKALKNGLLRSNTRGVYKSDHDDVWVSGNRRIQEIAAEIEKRRIELGKTSGFERLYGRVTRLYFGGMARHLSDLRIVLRPGAKLAYVVGDQASYLRVMIRTGAIFADIAQALGYEVVRVDLFRTRFATATKEQLREEVVVLRWPGERRLDGQEPI